MSSRSSSRSTRNILQWIAFRRADRLMTRTLGSLAAGEDIASFRISMANFGAERYVSLGLGLLCFVLGGRSELDAQARQGQITYRTSAKRLLTVGIRAVRKTHLSDRESTLAIQFWCVSLKPDGLVMSRLF